MEPKEPRWRFKKKNPAKDFTLLNLHCAAAQGNLRTLSGITMLVYFNYPWICKYWNNLRCGKRETPTKRPQRPKINTERECYIHTQITTFITNYYFSRVMLFRFIDSIYIVGHSAKFAINILSFWYREQIIALDRVNI